MKVGDSARARGDWTTSAAFYGRAVALRPGQPDYVGPYAEALMHQGRTNEAIEAIHGAEANATSAERVRLALLLAQLLNTAQRSQEAIGVLLPVIQQNPNSAPLRVALGISYEISGDAQGARQSYRDALRIDPANIAAANDLALSEALGGGGSRSRRAPSFWPSGHRPSSAGHQRPRSPRSTEIWRLFTLLKANCRTRGNPHVRPRSAANRSSKICGSIRSCTPLRAWMPPRPQRGTETHRSVSWPLKALPCCRFRSLV